MADVTNPENEGDLQTQIEEVEALSSIYGEEWCVIDEASRIFCIKISDNLEEPKLTACLQIILLHDYPSAAPPIYQINAAWLRGPERTKLANSLEDLYVEHVGESILYLWVEKVREFLVEKSQSSETDEELPPIKHGNAITDRRSTFQPHLAPVVTPRQVKMVLGKLYENKKIASATHNIYAYRIYCEDKHSFLQDCEDDGETAAGGDCSIYCRTAKFGKYPHILEYQAIGFRMTADGLSQIHLMKIPPYHIWCPKTGCLKVVAREGCCILDVRNVMVVVSRWYGGILLGPDRFKHINNCARNILVEQGYTAAMDEATKSGAKTKRPKSKKTK